MKNFTKWKEQNADLSGVDRTMSYWYKNFTLRYFQIVKKYESSIIMTIGGQSLRTELRVPDSSAIPDLNHLIFNAPSISPLGSSNPAFSFVDLR